MKRLNLLIILWLCAGAALAATNRSAAQYYRDAASEYIAGQNASAAQTCEEGLRAHPGSRLQKLLERIRDNQEQQKKQCQNPQDSDSSQNKDKDQEKKPNQDQNKQDKNDKNQNGSGSSDSQSKGGEQGQSSGSKGSSNSQNQSGQGVSSSSASGNGMSEQAMPMRPGELNREQAQQLLKDFNQNSGERKAWRPVHGQSAPEKDW